MKHTTWACGLFVPADVIGVIALAGSVATRLLAVQVIAWLSRATARASFQPLHDPARCSAGTGRAGTRAIGPAT